jgi:hypothetical protein
MRTLYTTSYCSHRLIMKEKLYACVKAVAACDLSHVLTPSINSLYLKRCVLNQFFREVNKV